MSLLQNSSAISAAGGYNITDSLRIRSSATAYLNRTPSSAGNRKTWTWSGWVKLGSLTGNQALFTSDVSLAGSGTYATIRLVGGQLEYQNYNSGHIHYSYSAAKFRDPSAWYHIIVAVDTTQATASNRCKMYVNGVQITKTDYATFSQNADGYINDTYTHYLGTAQIGASNQYYDGYITEVNFVDGQALDPSYFGATNADGVWQPKEYTGSYGTNGFYLPMKETTQATGFNTVTYTGNSGTQSITGVGFSPDLVWIKGRTNTTNHVLSDSVRGTTKVLESDSTAAEYTVSTSITAFNSDGFTLGSDNDVNNSASGYNSYVAWCWDAGSSLNSTAGLFSSGNYLTFANNSAFEVGSDWTFDVYLNPTATGSFQSIYSYSSSGAGLYALTIGRTASGAIQLLGYNNGDGNFDGQITFGGTVPQGVWTRVTIVRSSGTWSCYLNEHLQTGSATMTAFSHSGTPTLYIGRQNDTYNNPFVGYMNNLRVVKGSALTPTTNSADLTAVTNTQLLTLQNAPIVDNSTNSFTVTVTGSVTTSTVNIATPTTNTQGTITSSVRANPATGFSVVSYAGNSTNGASVGHGLSSEPELIIYKNRNDVYNWYVHSTELTGKDYFLILNGTGAQATAGGWTGFTWDSTKITFPSTGYYGAFNNSGHNHIAYCFHSVAGYSKIGSYTGVTGDITVNCGFRPAFVMVKNTSSTGNWEIHDNTRYPSVASDTGYSARLRANDSSADAGFNDSPINFTDTGFVLDSSVTGNSYVDYDNNGNTYIYMAFADTRDFQWNFDASGNKNNWTPNNINSNASSETTYDLMSDAPSLADEDTSNFATWNPIYQGPSFTSSTYSNGNLNMLSGATYTQAIGSMGISSGKYYWEYVMTNVPTTTTLYGGVAGDPIASSNIRAYRYDTGTYFNGGTWNTYGATYTLNDVIGVALDMDSDTIEFFKNGTSQGQQTSIGLSGQTVFPHVYANTNGGIAVNFGQRPFKYTPPTGYKKLNTFNLPDSSITDGSQYFAPLTYTGDGNSTHAITGLDFSPDLVWIKDRGATWWHYLMDTVRGAGVAVWSNATDAEAAFGLTSIDSNGFTTTSDAGTNASGDSYISWNWRGSDSTAVSNTDGTITSTVSANTTSGFSVVTYTGNGTLGATIGHGLGIAPAMVIFKNRGSGTAGWATYHKNLTSASYALLLNSGAGQDNRGTQFLNNTAPSSSVVTLGNWTEVNASGNTYVAYCFAEVEGFSKFGSYTGNGSADGPFIYTGFRPAFIMTKCATAAGEWEMYDTSRGTYNAVSNTLEAQSSTAELNYYTIDILSNGFKQRQYYNTQNYSGQTFIYMAFAENPFKNSLAR